MQQIPCILITKQEKLFQHKSHVMTSRRRQINKQHHTNTITGVLIDDLNVTLPAEKIFFSGNTFILILYKINAQNFYQYCSIIKSSLHYIIRLKLYQHDFAY